jgi:hypothetical protein
LSYDLGHHKIQQIPAVNASNLSRRGAERQACGGEGSGLNCSLKRGLQPASTSICKATLMRLKAALRKLRQTVPNGFRRVFGRIHGAGDGGNQIFVKKILRRVVHLLLFASAFRRPGSGDKFNQNRQLFFVWLLNA